MRRTLSWTSPEVRALEQGLARLARHREALAAPAVRVAVDCLRIPSGMCFETYADRLERHEVTVEPGWGIRTSVFARIPHTVNEVVAVRVLGPADERYAS
jgi:hypothetical protein